MISGLMGRFRRGAYRWVQGCTVYGRRLKISPLFLESLACLSLAKGGEFPVATFWLRRQRQPLCASLLRVRWQRRCQRQCSHTG
jgi:hypothetical protein